MNHIWFWKRPFACPDYQENHQMIRLYVKRQWQKWEQQQNDGTFCVNSKICFRWAQYPSTSIAKCVSGEYNISPRKFQNIFRMSIDEYLYRFQNVSGECSTSTAIPKYVDSMIPCWFYNMFKWVQNILHIIPSVVNSLSPMPIQWQNTSLQWGCLGRLVRQFNGHLKKKILQLYKL